jgi:hypothetical protein
MVLEPSNLFGYTKYLIWTWTWIWSVMIPIKLVFQWRLMFDKKLKETSLPCYLTWNLTWKSGFGPYANEHKHKLILVLVGWSGRWWRCWKRLATNWSFFSKWFWNWFQLDFRVETPCVQLWFSVSARSIDRDSLVRVRTLYPVSSIVSSLVSRLVFTQYEPK